MSDIVDALGGDFIKIRRILRTIKENITVIAQSAWPSWGTSRNGSPNNISNLVLFWNLMNVWATSNNFQLQIFEAFDEPWKVDLNLLDKSKPNGVAGAEGWYGWWRRYDNNGTVTYIPKNEGIYSVKRLLKFLNTVSLPEYYN